MLLFVRFLIALLALFSCKLESSSSSFPAISKLTNDFENWNRGDICANNNNAEDDRVTPLSAAINNFQLGLVKLPLGMLDMHQNYFWCAAGGDNDFPGEDGGCGAIMSKDNDKCTFSSRTWRTWWRADYAWKRESVELLASLIYIMLHPGTIDFYSGMIAGRLFYARSMRDKVALNHALPISLELASSSEVSSFQKGRPLVNRFYTTINNTNSSSNGNIACMSAKSIMGNLYTGNNDGCCSQISLSQLASNKTLPSPQPISSNATTLITNMNSWFNTRIIQNHTMLHSKSNSGGTAVHPPDGSSDFYGALAQAKESTGHGSDGLAEFQMYHHRLQEMLRTGYDSNIASSTIASTCPIVTSNSFLPDAANIIIPITTDNPNQTFLITPSANVFLLDGHGNILSHTTGITGINGSNGMINLRAACLDLAATSDYLAFLGVGRISPPLNSDNKTMGNFDPYSGDNYFSYLRIIPNNNLMASGNYLNADSGFEGEDDSTSDQYIFFTDLDFANNSLLKSNYMKYVDFDKNSNLFILTNTGYILYYNASQLQNKPKGKLSPTLLDVIGITGQDNTQNIGGIDHISCGDGIIARSAQNPSLLYYLLDSEVTNPTPGLTWHECAWSSDPTSTACNFTYTNDGYLFVYDGDKITSMNKLDFMITVTTSLTTQPYISGTPSLYQKLAILCHEVLGKPGVDATYFSAAVDCPTTGKYLFINSLPDAQTWLYQLQTLYASLPEKNPANQQQDFWDESMSSVLTQALDFLTTKFAVVPGQETTDIGIAQTNFLASINSFEVNILATNPYFQIRTFQQTMLNLERLRTLKNSSDLKTEILSLMNDKPFSLAQTAFKNLNDILTNSTDLDTISKNPKITAKTSIIRQWIAANKANLITLGVLEKDLDNWDANLLASEQLVYTSDSINSSAVNKILVNIQNYLVLLDPSGTNNMCSKTSLITVDKQEIAAAFLDIATVCKNYMLDTDLQKIQNGFILLNNKFQLDTDHDFVTALKSDQSFSQLLVSELCLTYNTMRATSWFKACAQQTNDTSKIANLLTEIKTLVADRALFESVDETANTTSNSLTIGNGSVKDKNDFILYLSDLLTINTTLKNYESKINNPKADETSFYCQSIHLQAPAAAGDYAALLLELSGRQDAASNESIANALCTKLKSASLLSQLSPVNVTMINSAINAFKAKELFASVDTIDTTESGLATNFQGFLTQEQTAITSNLDSNKQTFSSSNKTLLLSRWQALTLYQDFSPNFNSDFQKNRFLSMLNCMACSFDAAIQGSLPTEDKYPALVKAQADVKNMIAKIN